MYDVIVVGGGPAGTAAATTAARYGARVLLLERGRFPRHKVCGEFVSPESLSLLQTLLGPRSPLLAPAARIAEARIFVDGRELRAPIRPAAASIARFDLDAVLWQAALEAGTDAHQQLTVHSISGSRPFVVQTGKETFLARSVIDASGRWSNLGLRPPANGGPKWIGLKGHFHEPDPPPSVDLYFFDGGYCGVQPVSHGVVNACAMVRADVADALSEVFAQQHDLLRRSHAWQPATEMVATAPLVFRAPAPLRDRVLLAGDAAGFIDPFVGDGIALGLRSGRLAAQSLASFWTGKRSLAGACSSYEEHYRQLFLPIFRNARRLRWLVMLPSAVRRPVIRLLACTGIPASFVRSTRGVATG